MGVLVGENWKTETGGGERGEGELAPRASEEKLPQISNIIYTR